MYKIYIGHYVANINYLSILQMVSALFIDKGRDMYSSNLITDNGIVLCGKKSIS